MRTFAHSAPYFIVLLVLCLMFAPSRRVTGDRMASAGPSEEVLPDLQTTKKQDFAELCRSNPLEAVAESLRAYKQLNLEGYSCTFVKQERIKGTLHPQETIVCDFREAPFSVIMRWKEGKRRAEATLYTAGENDDQLLIVPAGDLEKRLVKLTGKSYAKRGLESSDAKSAARYPVNQFGIYKLTTQAYSAWKAASEQEALRVEYRGIESVPALNGKKCHVLVRTCLQPEEDDGITKVVAYFDVESKLLLGIVLSGEPGLLGSYYYPSIQFNPAFETKHFKAEQFQ